MAYGYARVEAALAKAFDIDAPAMGSFRGRIQNFQRLGIVEPAPGTGRKIAYEPEIIYKLALALELAEFGIDPKLIKYVLDTVVWTKANYYLLRDGWEAVLVFYPNMLSGFTRYAEKRIEGALACDVVANLNELEKWKGGPPEMLKRRLGMINLADLRRRVEGALSSDQPVESAPRRKKEGRSPNVSP